eukprot:12770084-Alexandrium_andersonii.AAC.1
MSGMRARCMLVLRKDTPAVFRSATRVGHQANDIDHTSVVRGVRQHRAVHATCYRVVGVRS